MTLAIPGGKLHTSPDCPHLRYAMRRWHAAETLLVDATFADGCRTCYRRRVRAAREARRARDEQIRAEARREIASLPPEVVAARVSALSRRAAP